MGIKTNAQTLKNLTDFNNSFLFQVRKPTTVVTFSKNYSKKKINFYNTEVTTQLRDLTKKVKMQKKYPEDDVKSKDDVFETARDFALITTSAAATPFVARRSRRRSGRGRTSATRSLRGRHFEVRLLVN